MIVVNQLLVSPDCERNRLIRCHVDTYVISQDKNLSVSPQVCLKGGDGSTQTL